MWADIRPDEKIKLRVKGKEWCQIEVEIRAGVLHICGAIGDVVTRSELLPGDEVWMANSRCLFIVSGCGQIIDELRAFFPECIPHLEYHLERVVNIPKETLKWATTFYSAKQMKRIQRWRYAAAELGGE